MGQSMVRKTGTRARMESFTVKPERCAVDLLLLGKCCLDMLGQCICRLLLAFPTYTPKKHRKSVDLVVGFTGTTCLGEGSGRYRSSSDQCEAPEAPTR